MQSMAVRGGGAEKGRTRTGSANDLGTKKPRSGIPEKGFKDPAIPTFTLVGTIIGSQSLTTVFGMGTGITFAICSPERTGRRYFTPASPIVW